MKTYLSGRIRSLHSSFYGQTDLLVAVLSAVLLLPMLSGCGRGSSKPTVTAERIQAMLDKPIEDSEVTRRFYYDYNHQPDPGRRHWKRVGDEFWYELYPNGTRALFVILRKDQVGPARGIVGRKVTKESPGIDPPAEGAFEIFIPNKDTTSFLKTLSFRYYRSGNWEKWSNLNFIHDE